MPTGQYHVFFAMQSTAGYRNIVIAASVGILAGPSGDRYAAVITASVSLGDHIVQGRPAIRAVFAGSSLFVAPSQVTMHCLCFASARQAFRPPLNARVGTIHNGTNFCPFCAGKDCGIRFLLAAKQTRFYVLSFLQAPSADRTRQVAEFGLSLSLPFQHLTKRSEAFAVCGVTVRVIGRRNCKRRRC